jgi:hypothetical protein
MRCPAPRGCRDRSPSGNLDLWSFEDPDENFVQLINGVPITHDNIVLMSLPGGHHREALKNDEVGRCFLARYKRVKTKSGGTSSKSP